MVDALTYRSNGPTCSMRRLCIYVYDFHAAHEASSPIAPLCHIQDGGDVSAQSGVYVYMAMAATLYPSPWQHCNCQSWSRKLEKIGYTMDRSVINFDLFGNLSFGYLGVVLDNKLEWSANIETVYRRGQSHLRKKRGPSISVAI